MNIELKDIHLLFNESSGTKARSFTARFLECGLVSYEGEGLGKALLKKENVDKFIDKMINCPLIIKHNEVNEENVDSLAVGWITQVSYNEADGWYYCNGIITDEEGIDKAKDFGYVSCAVVPLNVDKSGGVWHDIKYDFEVLDADFNHLALVPNPRYGDATILLNSKMEKVEKKSSFKEKLFSWLANESGSDNEKKEDGTLVNESEKEEEKKDEEEKDTKDMENLKNSLKNSLSLKNKSMLKNEDLEALKKLSAYDLVKTMMEEADFHKDNPVSKESELKNESDDKKEDKKEDNKKEELKSYNNASDEDKKEEKKEEKEEKKEEKKETLENSTSLGKQLKNSFEEEKPAKIFMSKIEGLELAKKLGL